RIKWSSNTEKTFHSFLSSSECLSLYNQALTSSSAETISAFESLINSVQRELGANRRPSGPYHSRSNPWFDKECLMLRNQIKWVYLLYHNRGDKCPPEDYYHLKWESKGLIAKKKRAKEREKWDLLLFSIQQKNTRLFWQIVASSLPGQQGLPLCYWENHFLSIFQVSTSELGPQLPPASPDWQPMIHAEITEFISELKWQTFYCFHRSKVSVDSVPRGLLWSKLLKSSIDRRLLFLIRSLYNQISSQVRCGLQGELSNPIPIKSGVREGCVLAPLLFNLFLSVLTTYIGCTESHAPKLSTMKIPFLLYADDAVLLSLSRPGLKRLLSAFGSYCAENHLSINHDKSKVLVFSRAQKLYNWAINGNAIRQVFHFKYLGIQFQNTSTWTRHRTQVLNSASCSHQQILRFFSKTLVQALYGIPIWIQGFKDCIERTQAVFLRKLLGLPLCVGFALMYLELGI
ncbi:hypothetical protein E2320_007710, partial [Naja naja]